MRPGSPIIFPPFRLDAADQRLYRNSEPITLRPKAFAVLSHLLQRPGQLVTKDELLETVWPDTSVSEAVLKVCIREIREALADDAATPRFIETAHRRGYRFIGRLGPVTDSPEQTTVSSRVLAFGREAELQMLARVLDKAKSAERQILFVSGEPGIGKTTVVDAFLQRTASHDSVWYARGQCLEQYGEAEAYLPVLEALGRLCREPGHRSLVELLRRHAPMWLAQMPALIDGESRIALQREIVGATRERMLREMAEAIEVLTAEHALIMVLEDLHWADVSTLDLITRIARRHEPARFLLVGTYRPLELALTNHPLKAVVRELQAHGLCNALALDPLSEAAVASYLSARFAPNDLPQRLASFICRRTGGNPLFVINVVDYLTATRGIVLHDGVWRVEADLDRIATGVPENVRQMIEKQLDRLDRETQRILEAASVEGVEFAVPALASAVDADAMQVEEICDDLAQRYHFLKPGIDATQYCFTHSLYKDVLYSRIGAARRAKLHQSIGEWMEATSEARSGEIAAELAMHFEHARDYQRATRYLHQAAQNAIVRCANREGIALARRGLELLGMLPSSDERDQRQLQLQITLGVALLAADGYSTPIVGETYRRAREMCSRFGDVPELFPVLWGLWVFNVVREQLAPALEISEELLQHSARRQDSELLALAHWTKEATLVNLGDFIGAREHFERVLEFYDPRHTSAALQFWHDPGVAGRCFGAWALCCLGYPDQALKRIHEALALARNIRHPHVTSIALFFAAFVHQLRREPDHARPYAQELVALASKEGLGQWIAFGKIFYGWTLAKLGRPAEGVIALREGLAACEAIGSSISRPHFLSMLAEALVEAGQVPEALAALDEALTVSRHAHDRYYESELHRFKGELLLSANPRTVVEAEKCFRSSIEIARGQQAKWFELRTSLSLCRLDKGAIDQLTSAYDWFSEGFDTPDLLAAKTFRKL